MFTFLHLAAADRWRWYHICRSYDLQPATCWSR